MAEDDIRANVDKALFVAKQQVDFFEERIKECDFISAIDAYGRIADALQTASQLVPDLPMEERKAKIREIFEVHDRKHEFVKTIPNYCECKTKEAFRYVKEPPE